MTVGRFPLGKGGFASFTCLVRLQEQSVTTEGDKGYDTQSVIWVRKWPRASSQVAHMEGESWNKNFFLKKIDIYISERERNISDEREH